jgi:uncharacterized protein (DUF1697 family)
VTTYVALLRGVNVGRHRRLAMADLRAVLGELGHDDVSTHLQSGNAVFRSARRDPQALAHGIERGLADRLGLATRAIVRTGAQLAAVVDANPLPHAARDPSRFLVTFFEPAPAAEALAGLDLDPARCAPDEVRLGDGVAYTWYPDGVLAARLSPDGWDRLGVLTTSRNWNTVTRLRTLADATRG